MMRTREESDIKHMYLRITIKATLHISHWLIASHVNLNGNQPQVDYARGSNYSYARTHLIYAGSGFLYRLEERNVYRFVFINDFPAFFRLRALRINSKPNYIYASEYRRREWTHEEACSSSTAKMCNLSNRKSKRCHRSLII